jgi:hypothetical protein
MDDRFSFGQADRDDVQETADDQTEQGGWRYGEPNVYVHAPPTVKRRKGNPTALPFLRRDSLRFVNH